MVSKAPKASTKGFTDVKRHAVECDEILSTIFNNTIPHELDDKDSRRRLEDRIEAFRLRKEILEFDFDIDF